MFRFPKTGRKPLSACLALLVSLAFLAGCGEKPAEPVKTPKKSSAQKRREERLTEERQRQLEIKKRLESIRMPTELPKEWFYDGDDTYELTPEWKVATSRLHFTLKQKSRKRKRAKKGQEPKLLVGFYGADHVRGPYTYLARVMGTSVALPQEFPLGDVRHRYYKAVVFDDKGKAAHHTTPVRPAIDERRTASKPRKKKKSAAMPTEAGTEGEQGKAPPPAPPKKPRIAVALLHNATPKDTFERHYLGRGFAELLREFCGQIPDIETPDPTYVDVVLGRRRTRRRALTAATLAGIGKALRVDTVISGSFEVTGKRIAVDLSFVNVGTGAAMKSQSVSAVNAESEKMGAALAAELSRGLKLDLDAGKQSKFALMWKELNERRLHVEKALRMLEEEKPAEAVAAFESVKAHEIRDPEVLLAMARTYSRRGNRPEGARLMALASHVPNWQAPRNYLANLGRLLSNTRDLNGALEVLADVRLDNRRGIWEEGVRLLDRSLAGRVISHSWQSTRKAWPTLPAAWQVTTDQMLINPHIAEDSLVVFGSSAAKAVKVLLDPSKAASGRGLVRSEYASPEHFDTSVYDVGTGELRWQTRKLMSGVMVPAIAEGALFGMGPEGPLAVSLKNGEVIWRDKSGRVKLPSAGQASTIDHGRPWWLTFEFGRTGEHLVVWHPKQNTVHAYDAKTGEQRAPAYHNDTWGKAGQFFMRKADGLYFLRRGGSQLVRLTDGLLASPANLTTQLRMLSDPNAVLDGDVLYEATRRRSRTDTSRFDCFIVASDVTKGQFKWIYPLLSRHTPVIAAGKIFIYKKSITGTRSARVQMIDVENKDTKTIDMSVMEIGLYEPTLALPGGKAVLIGSQAALSATDGKVLWVNRNLPATRRVRMVGKYLFVAPFIVNPATGRIVFELQVPPGFSWDRVTVASGAGHVVVTRSYSIKRGRESRLESRMRAYDLKVQDAKPAGDEPAEDKPKPAPETAMPTVNQVEAAFLESDVAPPLDDHMYDLFERVAAAKYENTGSAGDSVDYLTTLLKTRPHNGQHLVRLAGIMKPYASMADRHDHFIGLLSNIKEAYKGNEEVVEALAKAGNQAQQDKADAARAARYFETIKKAEHDPLEDWPSEMPASGAGNRGGAVAPPFNIGWTQKTPRITPFDRVVPAELAIFVYQKRARTLVALKPSNGDKLWELRKVRNFVYYHGVVYVLADDLRALTPREGLVLWKKKLDPTQSRRNAAMAAGQNILFLALPAGIQAFDWGTGRELYRLDLPGKDRIDVHGPVLAAVTRNTGKLHVVEAKSGDRRWTDNVGAYSLFDGRLYSFSFKRDSKKVDLLLVCRHASSGRELWRRNYELPPGRKPPEMVPPAVGFDDIAVVCDKTLLHLKRESGQVVAQQTLPGYVTQPLASTPSLVYVNGADKKLVAYDLTNDLTSVWELPATGKGAVVLARGTLFVLDKGELKAYRGEKQDYSDEHLKALAQPAEDAGQPGDDVAKDPKIRKSRFVTIGVIRDVKELPAKMDDARLSVIAFQQLVHLGHLRDWKLMLDELTKRLAPGERKTRHLTEQEVRMLYAEMIQRQESRSMEVVKAALRSGNRKMTGIVLDLMTTGDRATYGPLLLGVFRKALRSEKFMTAMYCAEAVGNWRLETGVPLLIKALGNAKSPKNIRFAAAKSLALFDRPEATAALARAARDEMRSALPRHCIDLLVKKGPDGVKAVGALLASSSTKESTRIIAARALGQAKGDEAVPFLLAALTARGGSYTLKVRATAAASLGPLSKGREEVFKTLLSYMKDSKNKPYLRNACMNGLGMSDNPKAIPHLIAVMGDRDVDSRKFTRTSVHQMLRRLTREKRVGQYKDEWERWWQRNKNRFE